MPSIEGESSPYDRSSRLRAGAAGGLLPRLKVAAWLTLAIALGSELWALSGGTPSSSVHLALAGSACVILAAIELQLSPFVRAPRGVAEEQPPVEPSEHRIADLSHDLRNPLAVAIGYSEMAGDEELPNEERARALARVKRSLWELTQMVENVLESSAEEAGSLVLATEAVEVGPLCDELGASAKILVRSRPLRVQTFAEPDLFVTADRQRLVRVLSNLIGNAIKYTERGDVVLRAVRAGDRVVFEVRDSGRGIASDQLTRIFERYQQLPNGSPRGGVGLGLAISRLLTERMGGAITVESSLGLGSRFQVSLPIAACASRPSLEPKAA